MEVGQYIFTHWIHNEGFESKWLRMITRQSETHLFCDVIPRLITKKGTSNFTYKINKDWAERFKYDENNVFPVKTHLDNPDGIFTAKLVNDFSELICKEPYEKMFNLDIRENIKDDKFYEKCEKIAEFYKKNLKKEEVDKQWMLKSESEVDRLKKNLEIIDNKLYKKACKSLIPIYQNIENHLKELFNIKTVEEVSKTLIFEKLPARHGLNIYSQNAIHYHMNFYWKKDILSFEENQYNATIAFWLFKDRLVYQKEDGIDTW